MINHLLEPEEVATTARNIVEGTPIHCSGCGRHINPERASVRKKIGLAPLCKSCAEITKPYVGKEVRGELVKTCSENSKYILYKGHALQ